MKTRLLIVAAFVAGCLTTAAQTPPHPLASGVWRLTVGTPESTSLTSELSFTPRLEAIDRMGSSPLPEGLKGMTAKVVDGKTYLSFPLTKREKIFGLGLHFKTVEQRGRIMQLHVDHYGGVDNGRTHAPVPFFVSSEGYGVLINSARYIDLWVGTAVKRDSPNAPAEQDRNTDRNWAAQPYSDNIAVRVPAEGVELIVFSGKSMLDVVRRYNLFMGGGPLPPRWGLGFWHRVPTLYTDRQVEAEVTEFEQRGFPLSVVGLEPGWMSRSYPCTYEWDKGRFPDPAAFVKGMEQRKIKTNLWINPYISKQSELYAPMKPYTADYTVWNGIIPDYSMPEATKLSVAHLKKHQLEMGVSGYKMDENDGVDSWLWPDVAQFPSGRPAEQMRQIYGSLMQSFTTEMFRETNRRTYGLVRAGNAGTNSYPYVIYNDYYNHRDFITALINSSFIGVLWTPEVRAGKSSEEWLRRMQTVCFSPLAMLNAWADGTKPWSFPEVEKEVQAVAELRTRLIPYLYTAFADYCFEGTPFVRAMNLEEGYNVASTEEQQTLDATRNPYAMAVRREAKDQFMVGPSLLVAPLFAGETERKVVLPQGRWFDFYTGEEVGSGEVITVKPGLERIPVYVKDGGIVPLYARPLTKITDDKHPVEVRYYGSKPSSYSLYDDDGTTFDYERGAFVRIALEVTLDKRGRPTGKAVVPKGKTLWSFTDFTFRYMTPR